MAEPKRTDVRPYIVRDLANPSRVRVVIHGSPEAAIAHAAQGLFAAEPMNAMDILAFQARGGTIEDPRGSLPKLPSAPPVAPPAPDPPLDIEPGTLVLEPEGALS